MSLQTFKKILPFCSTTALLHLQGWGEPFLNPDFFEMIYLDNIIADGRARGVEIHYQVPGAEQHPLCSENVLKSLVVSPDGNVSPCVFTNMPLINANAVSEAHATSYIPLRLGNIHTTPLDQIWWQKRAKTLRRSFAQRQYLPPCIDCSKRRIVTDQASLKPSTDSDILNLPD